VLVISSVNEYGEMILSGKIEVLGKCACPIALCLPKSHTDWTGFRSGPRQCAGVISYFV